MPSIDRVIHAMQDTIHDVNDFFMKLRNRPGSDKQSDKEYISVCRMIDFVDDDGDCDQSVSNRCIRMLEDAPSIVMHE